MQRLSSSPVHRSREELANGLTHGLGLLASLFGVPVLVVLAAGHGDAWQVVGSSVFAATLVTLYATSTVYHALRPSPAKQLFRLLDHAAIYLLIAGTYTPFTLGVLRGGWGWTLFGLVWGLAAVGIAFKVLAGPRARWGSTLFYLAMGWLVIVAVEPLWERVAGGGLLLLGAGGLLYTTGLIFFAQDARRRYFHAVWHLFVLGGSTCHYFAVLLYAGAAS